MALPLDVPDQIGMMILRARNVKARAPDAVDRPIARGGNDPAGWARRQPGGWPPLHGRGERVLHRLLGHVDIAEDADQHGHRASVLLAEYTFNLRGRKFRPARYQS